MTFTGETASGWQQVSFASPVRDRRRTPPTSPPTSPHPATTPSTSSYFAFGADNRAAAPPWPTATAARNGVYRYGATPPSRPTPTQSTNYWVDVVFSASVAPDTTPPTVTSTSPTAGSSSAPVDSTAQATFSEGIDPATVTGSTFTLRNAQAQTVAASVSYDSTSRTATLTPSSPLASGATYTATVTAARAA